jgi:hypothetical protein
VLERPQPALFRARYDIARLTRKLKPTSLVRFWLEDHHKGVATANVHTLLPTLQNRSSDWADRAVGYHILAALSLSPSEQESASHLLVKALKEPNDEKPTTTPDSLKGVAALYLITLLSAAAMLDYVAGSLLAGVFFGAIAAGFVTLFSGSIFLGIQDQLRANTLQRVAATSLATVGVPPCLGVLYHYIRRPSLYRKEAHHALQALLPRVTADWYGQLPADASAALTGLAGASDETLALAALDALEQAGGGATAKAIERVAVRSPIPAVRERAAVVLPILMARLENEKSAASLLRPSALDPTENLVRPVYASAPDTTNLLRASHTESSQASRDDTTQPGQERTDSRNRKG